ncbi:hypothetical protein GCM10011345_02590 [Gemmobacter megaterium]|uniref:hypothetical protein n=1 Tax=Gemmobacter megaterium TaxID=1086013 RepID=UPI000970B4C6|nr:hypothetical protein [Gemmobacter megaterium]GGE00768.1 hypothetical protein GCM10011345_02590 [Gemmobacter megaterium]
MKTTLSKFIGIASLFVLASCAETSVQPMSKDTFKVQTHAAPACGPTGARNLAFKAAAIEVIRKGGDKFVIVNDSTGSGLQGDFFSGFNQNFNQGMVVRIIPEGSREASNALSAREVLGASWQETVSKGVPNTCS